MSVNVSNGRQVIHKYYIYYLNDVNELKANNPNLVCGVGAIRLPSAKGNCMFHIISTMFQLLQ